MGAIAGFLSPFLEYLRPTKSPYLMIAMAAVILICFSLKGHAGASLYRPEFFIPIYLVLLVIVPLSLLKPTITMPSPSAESSDASLSDSTYGQPDGKVENSKFENDAESVFKFSRAINLVCAIVTMFVYYNDESVWSPYVWTSYVIILVHMAIFLAFIAFRQIRGEDISNNNLFQVALLTATFFCGATSSALHIEWNEAQFLYRCHQTYVVYQGEDIDPEPVGCNFQTNRDKTISKILTIYRPDFRQMSFLFFCLCWGVYELFWTLSIFAAFRKSSVSSGRLSSQAT